jgi:uroporphyrinogen III methyltransferase/synthase
LNRSTRDEPLKGVTCIWTGSSDAAQELLLALEKAGATVERHPLIDFGPPADPDRVRVVLENLDRFSWVVFTSAQAAQAVKGLPPPSGRVATVGPSTEARLKENGWRVQLTPERHDAQGLAKALEETNQTCGDVLFVRGDRAGRTIPEQLASKGFQVEEIEVYTTVPVDSESAAQVARRIAKVADVAIMGSPSGVLTLSQAVAPLSLSEIKSGLKWVCLGRATSASLGENGVSDAAFPKKVIPQQFVKTVIKVLKS